MTTSLVKNVMASDRECSRKESDLRIVTSDKHRHSPGDLHSPLCSALEADQEMYAHYVEKVHLLIGPSRNTKLDLTEIISGFVLGKCHVRAKLVFEGSPSRAI